MLKLTLTLLPCAPICTAWASDAIAGSLAACNWARLARSVKVSATVFASGALSATAWAVTTTELPNFTPPAADWMLWKGPCPLSPGTFGAVCGG